MDIRKAAAATMKVVEGRGPWVNPGRPELTLDHLRSMCAAMTSGGMSYGKLCRWLGWMQAAACAAGRVTLEECKDINRQFADPAGAGAGAGMPAQRVSELGAHIDEGGRLSHENGAELYAEVVRLRQIVGG